MHKIDLPAAGRRSGTILNDSQSLLALLPLSRTSVRCYKRENWKENNGRLTGSFGLLFWTDATDFAVVARVPFDRVHPAAVTKKAQCGFHAVLPLLLCVLG